MRDGADGPTDADARAGTRGQTAESALGASTFLLREQRTLKSEEHQHDKECDDPARQQQHGTSALEMMEINI